MPKESFVFYLDWIDHLATLEPHEVMLVLKEIQVHMDGRSTGNLSGAAAMAFCFIRAQLDRDLKKWDDTRKKRSDAGKIGAMVTNSRHKSANPANADFDDQQSTNPAVNVPVNVPVPEPVIDIGADKPPRTKFIPPTLDEVAAYIVERGSNVDAQTFIDFYQAKGWMVGKTKMKDWKAACRRAEKWDCWEKPADQGFVYDPGDTSWSL